MEVPIEKINKLIQQIQSNQSLLEFETIELPFQLVEAAINLWESTFTPEVLRQLATSDEDTLNAWAIALSQTLNTQLQLLNNWLSQLATLPVPPALQQQIRSRIQTLSQIANEKSQLLQSADWLLSQEQQLRRDGEELQQLQQKASQLQAIQTQLQTTNLESLRGEIHSLAVAIEPQRQTLETLQQQKAQMDEQMAAIQQQKERLQEEMNYMRSRFSRLETSTANTASSLITLAKSQQEGLRDALASVLADLEKQQSEFQQTQQQLQQAIQDFNQYQTATEEMRTHLTTHYQSDSELGRLLPANRQKVDTLIGNIQEKLAELDQELAAAQRTHSLSQQKTILTF